MAQIWYQLSEIIGLVLMFAGICAFAKLADDFLMPWETLRLRAKIGIALFALTLILGGMTAVEILGFGTHIAVKSGLPYRADDEL